MIRITPSIALDERAIEENFIRASGPGGQNVNKVATAVQLRLSLDAAGLPPPVRARLERLAGHRLTQAGDVLITAQRHRTQDRNRAEALEMLVALIRAAAVAPVRRVKTRPTLASKQRRLEAKAHRARVKSTRGGRGDPD
ncbi:MAG: aminoacyl-tRNA hydrolase [Rhodospirillales bacterium 69-11]|nr:aminoacyl-tRNA hydrolase [Rhodospirillales bacterium]OJW23781.1 MAG: aminoacyl-tRNA hydrolase [Rhodospirillales bacterium 69-11]